MRHGLGGLYCDADFTFEVKSGFFTSYGPSVELLNQHDFLPFS